MRMSPLFYKAQLYNVSANVYPNIPVGAVDDLAFNLFDHNVGRLSALDLVDAVW